ncbi:MAG: phytanoyl-CoA dioxygenase family protein [Planctomycetaceae bacterium]
MNEALSEDQLTAWNSTGHLTVPDLFTRAAMLEAVEDLNIWSREFLQTLSTAEESWFLERTDAAGRHLRKLDNPVFHRKVFRKLATDPRLLSLVTELIGPHLRIFFSQVFLKPPGTGGSKPVHQDNYYFGAAEPDQVLTAWIAIDDATLENGCLHFTDGSHRQPVLPHCAPPDEPFNLQVLPESAAQFQMTPAPVRQGGVSFHHGNTLHQSGENRTAAPRRAVAVHFLSRHNRLVSPALDYDPAICVAATPQVF